VSCKSISEKGYHQRNNKKKTFFFLNIKSSQKNH